ncbi:NUDIX hydrolase [Siphonobacter sp. SORGH_AS_0500]|uniref:NUDIX hydrolase n=1 Tax=Siphonobacter sp. SORGH_AS_0500 TaxID=1864824 RepID=UPI00285EA808|nr:NUDIX hydrolase [Siphonobacter sp. SORGH_AS_0500]MDR6194171.1 8-oxo-dGTP pyrophosphatase MutT (NUDIX family) [Siphonobacter sp. SORGH_AS_0500]
MQQLLDLLKQYQTTDANEEAMRLRLMEFVQTHENCFDRTLLIGHVTGSAWILDETGTQALLMHHRKLDRWFQPGGHCDGDPNVQGVAQREAWEETGAEVTPVGDGIFDIDIHTIPARKQEPEHLHYDVRFLFRADATKELLINEESNEIKWIPLNEVRLHNDEESMMRMVRKSVLNGRMSE